MRKYNRFTTDDLNPDEAAKQKEERSVSEEMDHWNEAFKVNPKALNNEELEEVLEELSSPKDEFITFSLKGPIGDLCFKQKHSDDFTSFVHASIDLLLTFVGSEIDPVFRRSLQKALSNISDEEDDSDEEEEDDRGLSAYEAKWLQHKANDLALRENETKKFTSTLPKSDKVWLSVLDFDGSDFREIKSLIDASLPESDDDDLVKEILFRRKAFSLPFEEGVVLYQKLRMLEAFVHIGATEKSAPFIKETVTGKEKLPNTIPNVC